VRLRDIRRDAGLSGTELASRCGWPGSKVSKIEHGRQTPADEDLRNWCEHCHAAAELPSLTAAARNIEKQAAERRRTRWEAVATAWQRARMLRIYEPAVIPGLLQTREYAVTVLLTVADFLRAPLDAEKAADERLERQRVLSHEDRRFHILLGENALRTRVGGPGTMTAQLERLLSVSGLPRVRFGIVPADAPYRGQPGHGFWIMDEALVQAETYTGELALSQPEEITLYGKAFERLAALAVYGTEAQEAITRALSTSRSVLRESRPGGGGS
jgi:transcriptional regulator with XRE-family HTH domain